MAVQGDTIGDLTEAMSAAGGDFIELEVAATGLSRKIQKDNFFGAALTGGGAIDTGGFTLTVPATGTAALKTGSPTAGRVASWAGANTVQDAGFAVSDIARLSQVQTFTANQRINALMGVNAAPNSDHQVSIASSAAGRRALLLTMPASPTVSQMRIHNSAGDPAFTMFGFNSFNRGIVLGTWPFDNDASFGAQLFLARNENGSTPAAGHVAMSDLNNTTHYVWPDASGNLRIGTNAPTNANDTSGTVVGSQSSAATAKDIDSELPDWRESINHIIEAVQAGALRSWKYKSGAYNHEHYPIGIVTDISPRYGQDKNRSLNIPVAIGDLMGAVVTLAERVKELEAKLNG